MANLPEKMNITVVVWLDADEESGTPEDHRCLRTTVGFVNPADNDPDYLILWTDRDIDDDDPRKTVFSGRLRIPHGMIWQQMRRSFLELSSMTGERKTRRGKGR